MLTVEQLNKIRQLSISKKESIFYELIEDFGLVSVKEYIEITCEKRSSVYKNIKDGKIKVIKISDVIFIPINLNLK